jgi:hypothetical protein
MHKRPPIDPDSSVQSKKNRSSSSAADPPPATRSILGGRILGEALIIFNKVASTYSTDPNDPNAAVIFGQLSQELPRRQTIFNYSYASNPWKDGYVPAPLESSVAHELEAVFTKTSNEELER